MVLRLRARVSEPGLVHMTKALSGEAAQGSEGYTSCPRSYRRITAAIKRRLLPTSFSARFSALREFNELGNPRPLFPTHSGWDFKYFAATL